MMRATPGLPAPDPHAPPRSPFGVVAGGCYGLATIAAMAVLALGAGTHRGDARGVRIAVPVPRPAAPVDAGAPGARPPEPTGILAIEILDGDSRPVPRARLRVVGISLAGEPVSVPPFTGPAPEAIQPFGELGVVRGPIPFPPASAVPASAPIETDAEGRARIEAPAGRLSVVVAHPDFTESRSPEVSLGAGAVFAVRVTLAPASQPSTALAAGRLLGMVTDERGFPVPAVTVAASAGAFHGEVTSDALGRFQLDAVPEGTVALRATHPSHPPLTSEARVGDEARLELAPGGGIAGDARDERTGVPLAGARVIFEAEEFSRAVRVDPAGRFEIIGCPPGKGTLRIEAGLYLPQAKSIELPAGESLGEITLRDQRFDLVLGGAVAGAVRDARNAPAARQLVEAGEPDARRSTVTDAVGHYRLAPLSPGRVEVRCGSQSETVRIDAGRTTPLDLRLAP